MHVTERQSPARGATHAGGSLAGRQTEAEGQWAELRERERERVFHLFSVPLEVMWYLCRHLNSGRNHRERATGKSRPFVKVVVGVMQKEANDVGLSIWGRSGSPRL